MDSKYANEPLVSVIMPTYNSCKYIEDSIKSVLEQSYRNWELIIIDDCSEDNTKEIVRKFQKEQGNIQYYKLEKNSGPAIARNRAIDMANGAYLAFLDSDDLWTSDKLKKQVEFMECNKYNFTCTSYDQIDEHGKNKNFKIVSKKKLAYKDLLKNNYVGNSTAIYNCKNLGKIKIPNIRKRNDYALWLQVLKKEKYVYGLNEVLMHYRVRENSVSSKKIDLIKYQWQLYHEIEKVSFLKTIYFITRISILKLLKLK